MRKLLISLAFATISLMGVAQDTSWVNTLNFQDITKRKGTYLFPDGKTYRKINMHYTLKCDPQTTRDNFDCGEWDYLSYIIVHDSTGRWDSTKMEHSNFLIGDWSPVQFDMTANPASDTFYRYDRYRVVDNLLSADSALVGANTTTQPIFTSNRGQYLYTAAELNAAGFTPGEITALSLFVTSVTGTIEDCNLRIAQTNANQLTAINRPEFNLVYEGDMQLNLGKNRIQFIEPLLWDGVSNLLLEFSRDDLTPTGNLEIEAGIAASNAITTVGKDHYYESFGYNFLEVQNPTTVFNGLDSAISIGFWAKGGESLPKNTSIIEAVDASGKRILNIHFPWGNGQVYWDAGNSEGYDRINKAANENDFKNRWNHWVFTKNTKTGSMKIYLNGALWLSGTDKNRELGEIASIRIGKGNSGNSYPGKIDRLSFWNSELSASEVTDLMKKEIDNTQPNFSDLICAFSFENYTQNQSFTSDFDNSIEAWVRGNGNIHPYGGESFFSSTPGNYRPGIELVIASQTSHLDSTLAFTIVPRPVTFIDRFDDNADPTKQTSTTVAFAGGHSYSFHPDGSKKDSSSISTSQQLVRTLQPYYIPYEVVNNIEIGRYITPYGIGLDLGPDGFKWIYDVTDYAELLSGKVTLSAGNQQELIDLRFEMIEGTPARDLKEISYVIPRTSKSYRSIADDESFPETDVDINAEAKTFKLVTRITGHGHNTDNNTKPHCCEWADKTHYLKVNGLDALEWDIWQDDKCALNPIFDQGGNWAPPRAGWCPGAPVDDYNFDLTPYISGTSAKINYEIEPVPVDNLGQGGGNYVVAMHLMQYGDYNFENDATVEQIISPNNWEFYSRLNPTCTQPKIRVRNTGKNAITELGLRYGVVGGNPITYYWKDTLLSNQSAEVDLPFAVWDYLTSEEEMTFYAEVFSINKGQDEYEANNRSEANFNVPNVAPKKFTVFFRNNNLEDATLQIFNDGGQVVYEQLEAPAGQLIKEDITLNPGCYKLVCETENQFGLYYPLIPEVGSGLLRLIGTGTSFSESFNPDFGKSIEYHFTVSYPLSTPEITTYQWKLYPNPSEGQVTLHTEGTVAGKPYHIRVLSISGQEVFTQNGKLDAGILELDLRNQPAGVYAVELIENNHTSTFKVAIH